MSLTNENGMVMPVSPYYGNGGGNGNGFGNDGWWIILLLLVLGGRGFGGYGGGSGATYVESGVQRGFDQSAIMSGLSGIQSSVSSGFGDVQTALCSGFAGVSNGFAQAEIANNARQIADMQQMFSLQNQLSTCCCENRAATADLRYTIATEACADRAAAAANTQTILDKLCQLEMDAKNTRISELERQLTAANLAASQTAQTAKILADNAAQTVALEQYLNPAPIPAYVVQNPNCCTNTCGCGM